MIKVSDVNKSSEVNTSKVRKTEGGVSFSSFLQKSGAQPAAVSGAVTINAADAIFAAQMAGSVEEREARRKMIKHGQTLIEKLEEIRAGLLAGHISKDKLIEISRFVKDRRFQVEDEKLNEIIAEIELRVEVELAKLMR
jgi:hypothetical protein